MRIDPFFERQPKIEFIEDLKTPIHIAPPPNFGNGRAEKGEISLHGVYLNSTFSDPDGLLETAICDFQEFLNVTKSAGEKYPITLALGKVDGVESYEIQTDKSETLIIAEESEGIRRALVYLEGEMTKREGAILPLGTVRRKPYTKTRITRGFFSPTNRPPKYGDELYDDVNYYPDEYLNRLAHSNTNGLWIYTSFRALVKTKYFNDDSAKIERRIEKLKQIVKKCKRYGIKVFIFAIEPMGLLEEEVSDHKYFLGAAKASHYPICLRTDEARDYIIEATETLFRRVPDLGGYIDITAGERPTSCASLATYTTCPRCSKYSRGENLAYACDAIMEGIRRAGTGAEFISWTYGHRYWDDKDIEEYVKNIPDDVTMMQNFEDRGYNEQLGKPRIAFDYWLSYVGPSELYETTAKYAMREGKSLYAKMQICTSHELATVPYIPVPGIIHDKYRVARTMGTTGIMECWYFGNYPSLMSRASGELSFLPSLDDKASFLRDFAARIYGKTLAESIASAWECFEESYVNYPTNIMFSYYGPMHDGVVWDLSLIPKNRALPRSWMLIDPPDGDRIGECYFAGHTLDEILTLTQIMRDRWNDGVAMLPNIGAEECVSVAKSIATLFESGCNILNFYKLRGDLGRERGDANVILDRLAEIVRDEIALSERMIMLCEQDKRLGYHSEAEGFKFFPEKLRDRIFKLEKLLKTELPIVRSRIERGQHAIGYYFAEGEQLIRLCERVSIGENSFELSIDGDDLRLDIYTDKPVASSVYYEFEPGMPECGVVFGALETDTIHVESLTTCTDNIRLDTYAMSHQSAYGKRAEEELALYRYECIEDGNTTKTSLWREIPKQKWDKNGAFKMKLVVDGVSFKNDPDPVIALGKGNSSPEDYFFVV